MDISLSEEWKLLYSKLLEPDQISSQVRSNQYIAYVRHEMAWPGKLLTGQFPPRIRKQSQQCPSFPAIGFVHGKMLTLHKDAPTLSFN